MELPSQNQGVLVNRGQSFFSQSHRENTPAHDWVTPIHELRSAGLDEHGRSATLQLCEIRLIRLMNVGLIKR